MSLVRIIGMIIGLQLVYIVFNFLTDIFTKITEPILANALAITIMIGIIYVIYKKY